MMFMVQEQGTLNNNINKDSEGKGVDIAQYTMTPSTGIPGTPPPPILVHRLGWDTAGQNYLLNSECV
jgi:hypothetical protein